MAKHILGVLGVIAAGVLLLVSAAMNYRFGFSLGKTPADGQIYGAASAAADCFKALVPFFFFAAWRNRMWSQAFAAAIVWVVVTGYSMTSALGHAALNRLDMSGQRAAATANYKDMRADTKRAQDQLTWIPAHRPPETVSAELNVHKAQRFWLVTNECTDVKGKSAREYCQQFHKLNAELASGVEAQKLETRITDIGTKLARAAGGSVMAEADPQASVLAKVTGVEIETVQTGLALLVALLIEIGSGFGMYVAFAYWRMHGHEPQAVAVSASTANVAPLRTADRTLALPPAEAVEVEEPAALPAPAQPPATARLGANDNRTPAKRLLPDSDVQRFYREEVLATDGMSITLNDLYNSYCNWSEDQEKEPLAMPTFSREFRALGVRKEKIGGRVRYFDIALRSEQEAASEDKLAASKAA
ncbi:MAG TPA: hypothetical protein VFI87_13345 [Hyphomicrobiaceae bacterium]|jgi:hypothetical protein|nr:hypothetical protein [Hyphomicrobiaceae bacterium]